MTDFSQSKLWRFVQKVGETYPDFHWGSLIIFLVTLFIFFNDPVAILIPLGALFFFAYKTWFQYRISPLPYKKPLIHLNAAMAVRPNILKHKPPDGFRLACLYFGCGLIDRSQVLDHGFPYHVLDEIPQFTPTQRSSEAAQVDGFSAIVDKRAADLVAVARTRNQKIHLLWSGGIDSTVACCALLKALGDERERLVICHATRSIYEYHFFYRTVLKDLPKLQIERVAQAFLPKVIVVTGELGDQVFGSLKALRPFGPSSRSANPHLISPMLRRPWEQGLPLYMEAELASEQRALDAFHYLKPQIQSAPLDINDLFTCLWWLNFSMKWQPVSLRMMDATRYSKVSTFTDRTKHFFQTNDFQIWAMQNAGKGIGETWQSYKWVAKDYIYKFTQDPDYKNGKQKVPSLRGMIVPSKANAALAIDHHGNRLYQMRDFSLRGPRRRTEDQSNWSVEVELGSRDFNPRLEDDFWNGLGTEGE